jgi:biopolymer transport protein ExbD
VATGKPRSDEGAGNADEEGGDDSLFAEINITPLTDVFLVLVIIFMVSALAVQAEAQQQKKEVAEEREQVEADKKSGLKVNLPSGAAQEIDLNKKSLILIIPVQGNIAVNGTQVEDAQLDNMFRRAFLDDKNTQVVIQADKGVQHGRVVNVMERAKAAGLTRLAIGTTSGGK